MTRPLALVAPLVAALLTAPAQARTCAAGKGAPALEAVEAAQRLAFIKERLAKSAGWSKAWRWTWTGIWGVSTAAQVALIPLVDDPGSDIDNAWGAGFTGLSLASTWLVPMAAIEQDDRLRAMAAPSDEQLCAQLADAEQALELAADDQAASVGPLVHAVNVGLSAVYTLVLGLAYKRWESGLIGGGIGLAMGEAMIWSQPRRLVDDLESYREGKLASARAAPSTTRFAVAPWLGKDSVGFQLGARF